LDAQAKAVLDNLKKQRGEAEIWARAKLIRGDELTPEKLK